MMKVETTVVILAIFSLIQCEPRSDQAYWKGLAQNELSIALKVKWNLNTAKNVILFIGDGMGPNTVTATRIYKGGEGHKLSFENFPHIGMLKTYSADKMVPDSSCTATALLCGSKTNQEVLGVDASVTVNDCDGSLRPEARLDSLAADALKAGKSAGFVTTMRVTHATPAPIYAHSANRRWECEANMPAGSERCKDIARQLVEDWPGRDLQVILGGGMQMLVSNSSGSHPLDTWSCKRQDGKDLLKSYVQDKESRGLKYSYVQNNHGLRNLDVNETDYLLGIFANGHLMYEFERDDGPEGMPSIVDMTEAAIKVLQKNEKGFFLMVEGGNIDMTHHRGRAKTAINESSAFDDAVQLAQDMTDERDTLIIVTADHTHTLSINGYQDRGADLFGIAQASRWDNTNYTTLSYGTGGPGSMHYYAAVGPDGQVEVMRRDPSLEDTNDFYYEQVAGIRTDENTHGGGDVTVYAKGPYSHLFHSIHEQHYVYHAISFAAKLADHTEEPEGNSATKNTLTISILVCLGIFVLLQ